MGGYRTTASGWQLTVFYVSFVVIPTIGPWPLNNHSSSEVKANFPGQSGWPIHTRTMTHPL